MNKLTDTLKKLGNGKPTAEEKTILTVVSPVHNPDVNIPEEKKPVVEIKKEMTLMEKILKVENLQLVVEKRAKLVPKFNHNWVARICAQACIILKSFFE